MKKEEKQKIEEAQEYYQLILFPEPV